MTGIRVIAAAFAMVVVGYGTLLLYRYLRGLLRDALATIHRDRQARAQREADAHTFDLISKGKGGAI